MPPPNETDQAIDDLYRRTGFVAGRLMTEAATGYPHAKAIGTRLGSWFGPAMQSIVGAPRGGASGAAVTAQMGGMGAQAGGAAPSEADLKAAQHDFWQRFWELKGEADKLGGVYDASPEYKNLHPEK